MTIIPILMSREEAPPLSDFSLLLITFNGGLLCVQIT